MTDCHLFWPHLVLPTPVWEAPLSPPPSPAHGLFELFLTILDSMRVRAHSVQSPCTSQWRMHMGAIASALMISSE